MAESNPQDKKLSSLLKLADELGYVCHPSRIWRRLLANSISTRLRTKGDNMQYQSAAYHLANFPLSVAQEIFPTSSMITETETVVTWRLESVPEVSQTLHPLLTDTANFQTGSSKGLKTCSQRVIRVISMAIAPMEISWVALKSRGIEALYVNFDFVLIDEAGEIQAPKDNDRRPMNLVEEHAIRQQALQDTRALAQMGCPLSAGWYRQLGMEEKAREVESMLMQPRTSSRMTPRQTQEETYPIECILDERKTMGKARAWFLVRWEGYEPEWERWRIHGSVGEPLETWEPLAVVRNTEALQAWRHSQRLAEQL